MTTAARFLRQDVRAEPLVSRWLAWTQLIPPATAAMHLCHAHLPIMRSYLVDPTAHLEAARRGTELGAPVLTYDRLRVAEIRSLLDDTLAKEADLLALGEAIAALERLLRSEADGGSLDALYARVPEPLRGLVELVYDRDNHPSVRFIEPLLYRSRFYRRDAQALSLSRVTGPARLAGLNAPRLPGDEALSLAVPFDAPAIDALFAMKSAPRPPGEIGERLGLRGEEMDRLAPLLTEVPPAKPAPFRGPGMRIRYFGHACVSIEWAGAAVLVDPVIDHRYDGPPRHGAYDDLPDAIDYVLITHGHEDHLHLETLLELRHRVRAVVVPRSGGGSLHDPSLRLLLEAVGFRRVIEVDDLDRIPCEGGSLVAVPFLGEHGDLGVRGKTGWMVEGGGRKALFVADSDNVEPRLYERVREVVGSADALFVGMECEGSPLTSLYGPLFTAPLAAEHRASRRFRASDCARALDLVRTFGCSEVYVYAMGLEPWLQYLMNLHYDEASKPIVESERLVAACRGRGLQAERLYWDREILLR